MAAGIAHDFNNLLTSMLGFAHLAVPKLTGHSDIHRHVTRIVGGAILKKPFIPVEILSTVRRVLDAK